MKMIYKLSKSIKAIAVFLLVFLYEIFYVWTVNNTIEYTVDKHVKLIFEKRNQKRIYFACHINACFDRHKTDFTILTKAI